MQKRIAVKFVKARPPYNTGEIAGFSESIAIDLVRKKLAVLVNENEIEIKPEPEELKTGKPIQIFEFAAVLRKSKSEIDKAISEKNDLGIHKFTDSDLGNMLAEERNGKARKGVIKVIENEVFGRLNDDA